MGKLLPRNDKKREEKKGTDSFGPFLEAKKEVKWKDYARARTERVPVLPQPPPHRLSHILAEAEATVFSFSIFFL